MVSKATIVRTVILALALINQLLSIGGMSPLPIESEELSQWLSWSLTVAASLWSWWKNNSFTKNAIKADETLKQLRQVR